MNEAASGRKEGGEAYKHLTEQTTICIGHLYRRFAVDITWQYCQHLKKPSATAITRRIFE